MGLALFLSFEREIPEIEGWDMCGKTLARNIDELDETSQTLGLQPLGNMVSMSRKDSDGLLVEDLDEDPEAPETASPTKAPVKRKGRSEPEGLDDIVAEIEGDLADSEQDLKAALEGLPDEEWFSAAAGLKTVRGLMAHVRENPKKFKQSAALLEDLGEVDRYLAMADKEGVRFHLTPDF
jgi:hypothetical protein